jgi:hypothetical protein
MKTEIGKNKLDKRSWLSWLGSLMDAPNQRKDPDRRVAARQANMTQAAAAEPETKKLEREQKGLSRTPNPTGGKETNSSLDPTENKSSRHRKSEIRRKWNQGGRLRPGGLAHSGSLLRIEEETGEILSERTGMGTRNQRETRKLSTRC